MQEIELKFQVPLATRAAVDAAVAGSPKARRVRLQASYVDTAKRTLAAAGIALRLRREGRQWVQTLKGGGAGGLARFEHNVALGSAPALPAIDPRRHAGTPLGDRLLELLAADGGGAPAELFRTDILRRSRVVAAGSGQVELAFDAGAIHAAAARLAVCELEIELVSGSPQAVIDTARSWVPRHRLWLDLRSKAERGDLLARGQTLAPARKAQAVKLAQHVSAAQAWRAVLRECAAQIGINASQIGSGEFDAEHVHQLRIGLRRLRSAVALFGFVAPEPTFGAAAAAWFRRLGDARDAVVVDAEFGAALQQALHDAGIDAAMPEPAVPDDRDTPVEAVRDGASQSLLLDLIAAAHIAPAAGADGTEPAPPDVTRAVARRLKRWHRRAADDAANYAEHDDADRHRLRKRLKRIRYATEFCADLFERRALRAYLQPLKALQEQLGAINDTVVAMAAFRDAAQTDPHAGFALGWLAARRERLVAEARGPLRRFAKARQFWHKSA